MMRVVSTTKVRLQRLAVFAAVMLTFTALFLMPVGPVGPTGGGISLISATGSSGVFAPVVEYGHPTVFPWVATHLPRGYGPDDPSTVGCIQDAWTVASVAHGGDAVGAWRVLNIGGRVDVGVGDTYTSDPVGALSIRVPVATEPVPLFWLNDATGCSLTLAMTLSFWDSLDGGALLDGRTVAATGTVDTAGRIGDISGEEYKGAAVADAGIDVLFASPLDAFELSASAGPSVQVIAVTDIAEVVSWLETHRE